MCLPNSKCAFASRGRPSRRGASAMRSAGVSAVRVHFRQSQYDPTIMPFGVVSSMLYAVSCTYFQRRVKAKSWFARTASGRFFGRMAAPRVNSITSFNVVPLSAIEGQGTNVTPIPPTHAAAT